MKLFYSIALGLITFASFSQNQIEGLVGQWNFDGNLEDQSGGGNSGVSYGGEFATDRFGNSEGAYAFDGDDYILFSDDDMSIENEFTISLWYKTNSSNYDALLTKYSHSEDAGYSVQLDVSGYPELRGRDGNGVFSETDIFTTDVYSNCNAWHHFVGVVNGSTWLAYIDGKKVGEYDNGLTPQGFSNSSVLTLGRLSNEAEAGWRFFNGKIDDVSIYNNAVNQEEVEVLYYQGKNEIPTSGLVGRWDFNENTNDLSPNNNHGTPYGGEFTQDRFGNINSAYSFNGDDYIECSTEDMGIRDELTISVWFKTNSSQPDALIAKYDWNQDAGYAVQLDVSADFPEIRGRDGNDEFYETDIDQSKIDYSCSKWHHFVGIVDGSVWKSYIDGVLVGEIDNGSNNVNIGNCDLPLTFGRVAKYTNNGWRHFTGALDDIFIYNRALNENEVHDLMYGGSVQRQEITLCPGDEYTFADGTLMDDLSTGYAHTSILADSSGRDSVIIEEVSVVAIDTELIVEGETLMASELDATYQWVNCEDKYTAIPDATERAFSTEWTGSYAVEITKEGCTVISDCQSIILDIEDSTVNEYVVSIYPNPASHKLSVQLDREVDASFSIYTQQGQLVRHGTINDLNNLIDVHNLSSGTYFIKLESREFVKVYQFIKTE